ncbi:hypothetical protein Q7P36_001866 [Cladosporium allicinum]
MGRPHDWRVDASTLSATKGASFASNQTHIAFAQSGSIYVGKLESPGVFEIRCRSLPPHPFALRPILALSPLRPNLLSISTGSRTTIWNIENDSPECTIHDSERSVASSAWSTHDAELLALGSFDHISLYNVDKPYKPQKVFLIGAGRCHSLSWSLDGLLAACCGHSLLLWDVTKSHESLKRSFDLGHSVSKLYWRPQLCGTILAVASDGALEEWKTEESPDELSDSDDDQDDDLFGKLDGVKSSRAISPLHRTVIPAGSHVSTLGDSAVLILNRDDQSIRLYQSLQDVDTGEPIWTEQFSTRTEHIVVQPQHETIKVVGVGFQFMEEVVIPFDVYETCGAMTPPGPGQEAAQPLNFDLPSVHAKSLKTMNPMPVSAIVSMPTPIVMQEQFDISTIQSPASIRPITAQFTRANETAVSPREAMASSLELPKLYEEDSPMPFLSPTIPGRRPSPSAIPELSDDIILPPPETESFGSLPSTAMNDSDSDDETFDGDGLKGSGTLIVPSGANVPLPKSCGAFFSPNGQLITYFPPKARVRTANADGISSSQPEEQTTKASRLFPLFGNLSMEARDYEDSDDESTISGDETATHDSPAADIFTFPTPGDESWPDRLEHMQNSHGSHTVIVSVRNVHDLINFRPELARGYRTSCDSEESAKEASIANASVARTAGLEDLASIWSLLALLLQDTPALDLIGSTDVDILAVAQRANGLVKSGYLSRLSSTRDISLLAGSTWPQSKAGAKWLVERMFVWTELRADVQMLACLSAVLLSSAQSSSRTAKIPSIVSESRSPMFASDYFVEGLSHSSHAPNKSTPVLHADSREGSFLNRSPAKPPTSSVVSSRNTSQPTTPYVDSLSSTPPFPFPKLSRQGSRLSASGSASPEQHRSSFGAAAKFYAQSITDKISSYGTSPPARRFGTSPSNELSTSLPGAGSWKHVSFASAVDRGSRASTRFAPDDDGYDSDRTIEDTSLPHTPRRYGGPVLFTTKNNNAFIPSKEPQIPPQSPSLLSPSLAAKARIWIGHYTEQLRRLGMEIQAAELDKIARKPRDNDSAAAAQSKPTGVYPMPAAKKSQRATCSICRCKIHGVQQICPKCLHTTHLSCLSSFMEACGEEEEEMECPTGCGCECSTVSFEEVQWEKEAEAEAPQWKPPPIRRKFSFTDPRRWREQVQGDSW